MDKSEVYTVLFPLLRTSLWGQTCPKLSAKAYTDDVWEKVYEESVRQTVCGLAFEGLQYMPDEYMPKESLLAKWVATADKVERNNKRMNDTLAIVSRILHQKNLTPVLLKGQGVARFYKNPLSRECGDIDLYFSDMMQWKEAVDILGKEFRMKIARDGSAVCDCNGVVLEIHKTLFDMQLQKHDRILANVVGDNGFEMTSLFDELQILTPSPAVNLLLLNLHILRHALCFGIGLRQFCDYAVVYSHISNTNPKAIEQMKKTIGRLGLNKWNLLLESFISRYLGADNGNKLQSDGSPLFEIVLRGGNFGFHAPDNYRTSGTVIHNNIRLCRFAPAQSLMTLGCLFTRRLGI